MPVGVSISRSLTAKQRKSRSTSLFWIYAWAIASAVPVIPYATPLWSGALADTPFAYLVWIPVFAFTWAGWTLQRALAYNDDAELNGIIGFPVLLFSAALLVGGMTTWHYYFVGQSMGLLIWPLWAMGLAWLMFGVGVTKYLIRPLAYLWLTWPPLYTDIVNITNPILLGFANRLVTAMEHSFAWLHAGTSIGTYVIDYGMQTITVYVTSVCSGADSLLAVVILFPIILVSFTGSIIRKLVSLALAVLLALAANWLRLAILILSIHFVGPKFSLGVLHPVLGIILFMIMVAIVVRFSHLIGLKNRYFKKGTALRKPGTVRFSISVVFTAVLTILLLPLYYTSLGTDRAPVTISTNHLSALIPTLPGWGRRLIGRYDASTLLGPGAKSTAYSYTSIFGDPVIEEWWWTYQPISLAGYPEHNCLLFHGSQIVDERNLRITSNLSATVYTVLLPPQQIGGSQALFIDTVYTFAAKYHDKVAYIRSETATPVALKVTAQSQIVKDLPSVMPSFLRQSRPFSNLAIYPLTQITTAHIENYFTFIRQNAQKIFTKT